MIITSESTKDPKLGSESNEHAQDGSDQEEPGRHIHCGSPTALHISAHCWMSWPTPTIKSQADGTGWTILKESPGRTWHGEVEEIMISGAKVGCVSNCAFVPPLRSKRSSQGVLGKG